MMDLTEQDIQTLEGYWSNGLTAAEMSATRTRLEEEPDFREAAKQYQKTALLLEMHRTQAWLEVQKNERRQNQKDALPQSPIPNPTKAQPPTQPTPLTMKPVKSPVWVRAAAASAALFAIALAGYFYSANRTGPVEKFVAASFEAPRPLSSMSKLDEDKADAIRYYENKDFKNAIPLLEKIAKVDSDDSLKIFYLSICYIAENKPQAAIPILKNMLNSAKALEPEWFLALAYLRNKDYDTAKNIFEGMAQSTSASYQKRAAEGLAAIKAETSKTQ